MIDCFTFDPPFENPQGAKYMVRINFIYVTC